jgi:tRNA threonylcarbamoyladenosine biosynthesis protein TsaB
VTVLAMELSTAHGSVAVANAEGILFEARFAAARSHNAQLFDPLGRALEAAGDSLGGIVVGTGPGSYTGARIAIAAAQGISLSRGVPVAGISSLAACLEVNDYGILGDARRGRCYLAAVRCGELVAEIHLLPPAEISAMMRRMGLPRWISTDAFRDDLFGGGEIPEIERARPEAVILARRALAKPAGFWEQSRSQALEPRYLEEAFITKPRQRATVTPPPLR